MVYSVLTEAQRAKFEDAWELDGSVSLPGVARFRLNVSRQKNGIAAVFRVISKHVSSGEIADITHTLPREIRELWD